ncbi:MAG: HAMP domain-containing sensor histidine kinase [Sulfuricurvum sp.]|jgi:signal transduction histidine kinase
MESWLQRRLSHISLRELNFYTIVFILLLTVVFSSLLIYDEYQQFAHDSYAAATNTVGGNHKLKGQLIKVMVEIATLALIIFGFIVGISKIVNSMIARDMERFLTFFESAHEKKMSILANDLYFNEFKKMAVYANEMAAMIYEQKDSLYTLNVTLEEKVRQKTAALEVKNFALEEEKKFSQELLASQKQFIRYAIHETNTPLSVIMTNIELYTMNEGRNRYLAKIEAAVKNIFSIYDDLGYLVKKDQVEYPKRHIEVEEYVSSRIYFFDEVAQHAGLSFEFISECSGCVIEFNETKLQRIIDNNLTNAIKYTQPGETIRVWLVAEADAIRFSVESRSQRILDTDKIFEAYYRERKKTDGFGLGLNLVKSICDEEGVHIAITSDDAMTRFEYWFAKGVS